MEKKIAFRTKDMEGDVWCEIAFLFDSNIRANEFFKSDNPELQKIFSDEGETEELQEFKTFGTPDVNYVSFRTEYCGEVKIYEMHSGYFNFITLKKKNNGEENI